MKWFALVVEGGVIENNFLEKSASEVGSVAGFLENNESFVVVVDKGRVVGNLHESIVVAVVAISSALVLGAVVEAVFPVPTFAALGIPIVYVLLRVFVEISALVRVFVVEGVALVLVFVVVYVVVVARVVCAPLRSFVVVRKAVAVVVLVLASVSTTASDHALVSSEAVVTGLVPFFVVVATVVVVLVLSFVT